MDNEGFLDRNSVLKNIKTVIAKTMNNKPPIFIGVLGIYSGISNGERNNNQSNKKCPARNIELYLITSLVILRGVKKWRTTVGLCVGGVQNSSRPAAKAC